MKVKILRATAEDLLKHYQKNSPEILPIAQYSIGKMLVAEGFVGLKNHFNDTRRPGLLWPVVGLLVSALIVSTPALLSNLTKYNQMTEPTTARVVSNVQSTKKSSGDTSSTVCSIVAAYSVNGNQYTQWSAAGSSSSCSVARGDTIEIVYDPEQPSQWVPAGGMTELAMRAILYTGIIVGVLALLFAINRMRGMVYGWQLMRHGQKTSRTSTSGSSRLAISQQVQTMFIDLLHDRSRPKTARTTENTAEENMTNTRQE